MHGTVTNLLESYGYIFVFIVVAAESLGIPLPGETVLVTAAAYAALGHLDIYAVICVAASAAIVGDTGGYWIGSRGGVAVIKHWGGILHINESHISRARAFFEKHGGKTVFFGRFIAILRTWAAVFAGVAQMPYREFLIYNASGAIIWAALFGTLGYLFGKNLPRLDDLIGQTSVAIALLVALFVILVIVFRWFRANRDGIAERSATSWHRKIHSDRLDRYGSRYPRVWNFVSDRFARGEYLGLHLTIGLFISIGTLLLFGRITGDVIHHDPLTQLDVQIFHQLRDHSTIVGDTLMSAISFVGSPAVITLIAVAAALLLIGRRRWILLGGWTVAFLGEAVLNWTLKQVIQRPRPPGALLVMHHFSYSFPSGHAMGSLVGYGMLSYLLITFWATQKATRIVIAGASIAIVAAVGFSRIYLGLHYFSDVMGGYAAGAAWLVVCITGIEIARRQPRISGD